MNGVLTKGIKLSYKSGSSTDYTDLVNLYEMPDLGGDVDSIEITTFADSAHMYMNGIKNYGDTLSFSFYFAEQDTQFSTLSALAGSVNWKVSLPDGQAGAIDTTCTFSGECSVKLNGATYNEALTYTLSIKPDSAMVFA